MQKETVEFFRQQHLIKCVAFSSLYLHRRSVKLEFYLSSLSSDCYSSFQTRKTMAEGDEPQIYGKRYQIEKKLGAGNFGTAYLVTDLQAKTEP